MMKFYNKKIILFSFIILSCILGFPQIVSGQSFHNTGGDVNVTSSGQLQYTLPISLPLGIKDIAPNMDLTYLSGSGNGIAGYGWSVSGITTISRSGKNIDKDGELKGIQLDYSDYYSFNGQRLVLRAGEYGKDGAEYVTEKYSNAKIKSFGSITGQIWQGPEYWQITFEDGSQAWYGSTSSGNSTARTPLEYNIVKWRDKKGNYITYNYTQNNNISLINTIQWGGNEELGKSHFNKVDFLYSSRNVQESSYIKGISLVQDKRLSQITVLSNNSLFKNYAIKYSTQNLINNDPNNKINYDFVEKVIETNSAGEDANPATFLTKPLATGADETNFGDYNNIITTGDYNGDGLVDFIVMQPAQNGRPDGYYLYFDAVNNSSPSFVYLGSSSTYWPGSILTTFNIKSADNYIKAKQGLIITKETTYSQPTYTGNIELKYYSIKSDASVLNTFNNPLVLEYSKTIPSTSFHLSNNSSLYPPETDPDYMSGLIATQLSSIKEVDIDSDGMSELLISFGDRRCKHQTITLDPPKGYWMCKSLGYRYMVVDNTDIQNNTIHVIPGITPKNILSKGGIMDFDNDGKQDIVFIDPTGANTNAAYYTKSFISGNASSKISSTPMNTLAQYELKKENNNYTLDLKKSYPVKGLADGIQFGDLNGDKNIEVLLPLHEYKVNDEYTPGWSIYLNTGANLEESLQGLMIYKKDIVTRPDILSNSAIIDLDNDGKGEIVNSYTFFSNINTNLQVNWRLDSYSEPYYNPYDSQFKWRFNEKRLMSSERPKSVVSPLFGDFRVNNSSSKVLFLLKSTTASNERKLVSYQHYNLNLDKNISSISQANLQYDIDYKELDPAINANIYAPVKKEQYPYVEMDRLSQTYAVSQIRMAGRKQDFRYRGYIVNLLGKGVMGYRQTARSSWYADGFENAKIWNGVEIDPLNDGLPVKEWSIRTNNENLIFPTDISENNTQLLSFKSTIYQTDKLLNGQVIAGTIADADKPKIVTAIIPKANKTKSFLTGVVTESTITYGGYYLPVQSITNTNSGYGVTSSTFEYTHNPSGVGADYYIGRPETKTDQASAYGDAKSAKEEYIYENNLLKTLKTWNRDNTGYLQETYNYDSFGNITQKTVSNSEDVQTQTTKTEYDTNGSFVIKKIDNLGLETKFTKNSKGQILTQTDPLGNILTNTYDSWGKLLTSTTNLGGTTTYQYEKDLFSNIIVTQNDPDGDISKKFTNTLGQEYMTSVKAFNQGYYILKAIQYDALGRKIKESEPFFEGQGTNEWNTITYDDSIFPAKVTTTAFNGKQIETSISGLITTIKEINGYERSTSKTTDALGKVISSTDKGGVITFAYNSAGEQIKAQYAENIVTTKYDAWGMKSEFNDPSNGAYKYDYDGFGKPKKVTSPKGTKEYTYNNLGQLISKKELSTNDGGQATNKIIAFTYDTKGRLMAKSGTFNGQLFSSNITYDPQGRVLSNSESSNNRNYIQKGITYDNKGRVISYEKELQGGFTTKVTIENVYSPWNGELYQIKDKTTGKILWELKEANSKGQVLRGKLGAVDINNSYDTYGFLTNVNHSSAVKPNVLQLSYSFDAIKNELKNRTTGGDFNIVESFDYDDNNRLINWTNPITGIKPSLNRNVYDIKGRIMENDQAGMMKYENSAKIYQPTGMTLNAAGTQNYNNDLIQSIVYNENNDPVQINGEKAHVGFGYGLGSMRQSVYIEELRPSPIPGKPQLTWQSILNKYYNEDGDFEIVMDLINLKEKHILYIGGSPYESNIIYVKNYGETIGSFKFLHKDYIGSILAISDEVGNKLEQRHFDAWGNFTHLKMGNAPVIADKTLIAKTSLLIDRGYTSHEHFMNVGIIHMNGRLYDPLLRRFLNADENIQDSYNTQNYNKYGYVMNNPLMYNDPNGEYFFAISLPVLILGALKAVIIGGLIYTGMAVITGSASKAGFLKTVLTSFITGGIGAGMSEPNVFGNAFWGVAAQGAAIGAAGGTVDAIVNNTPVLQGVLKGAAIGGAVAAVSYTVNYYSHPRTQELTKAEYDSRGISDSGEALDPSVDTVRKLYKETGWDKMDTGAKQFYVDKVSDGYTKSGDLYINTEGDEVIAYTRRNFWKNNTSSISFSKYAFGSKIKLGFVMMHELAHSTINLNNSLNNFLQYKYERNGKIGYAPEMLNPFDGNPKISIEHGAIWGIERDFMELNGLKYLPGFEHKSWGAYFDIYFLKDKQYRNVYDAIKHLPVKIKP